MRWEQQLINAQVSVNRSIWEMHRPADLHQPRPIRPQYIIQELEAAQKNITEALKDLKNL